MLDLALVLQSTPDPVAIQHAMAILVPILLIFCVIAIVVVVLPFWFICKKAGFSPWLSLLNAVPLGNLILIYILAFSEWKILPAPQFGFPMPPPPFPPVPQQPPLPPSQS